MKDAIWYLIALATASVASSTPSFANKEVSGSDAFIRETKKEDCAEMYLDLLNDYAIVQRLSANGGSGSNPDLSVNFQLESRANGINNACKQVLGEKRWEKMKSKLESRDQATRQANEASCSQKYLHLLNDYAIAQQRSREGRYKSNSDLSVAFLFLESREDHIDVTCHETLGVNRWEDLKLRLKAQDTQGN